MILERPCAAGRRQSGTCGCGYKLPCDRAGRRLAGWQLSCRYQPVLQVALGGGSDSVQGLQR